jgi:hypothetical protein
VSRIPLLTGGRLVMIETDDPETKSFLARYWGVAVGRFVETGDDQELQKFRGYLVDGWLVETDPAAIEDFYRDFDFDFQELYQA